MEAATVDKIAKLVTEGDCKVLEIAGKSFTARPVHQVLPCEAEPDPVVLHSLTGLVGYLGANQDELDASKILVHVVSARRVDVVSAVQGEGRQRFKWATAVIHDALNEAQVVGRYMPVDEMGVYLNTLFCDGIEGGPCDRETAIGYVGNIATEAEVKLDDDGFTQKVTTRGGVVLVGETTVQNPLALSPFRTFREVEQPPSPFVLRFRAAHGGGAETALYLGDGGAWELAAVLNVVTFLGNELGNGYTVIG